MMEREKKIRKCKSCKLPLTLDPSRVGFKAGWNGETCNCFNDHNYNLLVHNLPSDKGREMRGMSRDDVRNSPYASLLEPRTYKSNLKDKKK